MVTGVLLAAKPAESSADSIPLWLQISLALAAPSVALLVGFLSVRQQKKTLEHDRKMRAQAARNEVLARSIQTMATLDSELTATANDDDRFHAYYYKTNTGVPDGIDGLQALHAEVLLVTPRKSQVVSLFDVTLGLAHAAVAAIRQETLDYPNEAIERYHDSIHEFIDEARGVAEGKPIRDAPPTGG